MTVNFTRFDLNPNWGFQTNSRLAVALDQNEPDYEERKTVIVTQGLGNICRVITYVPGVNVLSGAFRIFVLLTDEESAQKPKKDLIVRAALDIAFGPLLVIVDVIATIWNQRIAKQYIEAFKAENDGREPLVAFCSNHSITGEPNDTDGKPYYYLTLHPQVIIQNPTSKQKAKVKYLMDGGKTYPITAEAFFESVKS